MGITCKLVFNYSNVEGLEKVIPLMGRHFGKDWEMKKFDSRRQVEVIFNADDQEKFDGFWHEYDELM